MPRKRTQDSLGNDWTDNFIQKVWSNGVFDTNQGFRREEWGRDKRERAIRFVDYDQQTGYGWVIVEKDPNGGDEPENFEPLHWQDREIEN